MNENTTGIHKYYSTQSCITDPGRFSPLLDDLAFDIAELVNIIQGLILHLHWTEKYGVFPSNKQKEEANLRFVTKQLDLINNTDKRALIATRPVEGRILGTCRDYSVFLCSFLLHQGIPARARCGFGTYFTPEQYEDHWIA